MRTVTQHYRHIGGLIGIFSVLPMLLLAVVLHSSLAFAAEIDEAPFRTLEVVEALKMANWETAEPGLEIIRGTTSSGIVVTGFRVSPTQFSFHIGVQTEASGERASDVGYRERAKIAVNAGFFAETDDGLLSPVGFLRVDGQSFSKGWKSSGGFLVLQDSGIRLIPTANGIPEGSGDTLQSKPMLIEPGQQWSMRTNAGNIKRRTMLCVLPNQDILLFTITRSGMSLFEAGWVLRSQQEGGFFGCDSALALDGGRSTQVWVDNRPDLSFAGLSPVHNFLLVRRKD